MRMRRNIMYCYKYSLTLWNFWDVSRLPYGSLEHTWELLCVVCRFLLWAMVSKLGVTSKCCMHTLCMPLHTLCKLCELLFSRELKSGNTQISNKVKTLISSLSRIHRVLQGPTVLTPSAFDNMCTSLESYYILLVTRKGVNYVTVAWLRDTYQRLIPLSHT